MKISRAFLADLAERTAATYVETFSGLLIAGWADVADLGILSVAETAGVAAVPAALAVVKAGAARLRGDRESASLTRPPLRDSLTGESTGR